MNRNIINLKFDSLRRCVERIKSKRIKTPSQLESDFDLQDIISINLERAVQSCVDIAAIIASESDGPTPETMVECFDSLAKSKIISESTKDRMKKATAFRNLLVHEYAKIDWQIVFKIATLHLNDFQTFAKEVERWLKKKEK